MGSTRCRCRRCAPTAAASRSTSPSPCCSTTAAPSRASRRSCATGRRRSRNGARFSAGSATSRPSSRRFGKGLRRPGRREERRASTGERRGAKDRLLLAQVAARRDEDLRDVAGQLRLRVDDGRDPLDVGLRGDLTLVVDDRLRGLLGQREVLAGSLLRGLDPALGELLRLGGGVLHGGLSLGGGGHVVLLKGLG